MFDRLKEEINSIKARDPAVRSALEVIFLHCPVDIPELPQQNRH